jgi:hypothetical protein
MLSRKVFPMPNNKSFATGVKVKPFCKVCKDAGKEENIFSSHWVKNDQGKVCCPTLLAQECRYCYELGHTTNYCQELKKAKVFELKFDRRQAANEAERARVLADEIAKTNKRRPSTTAAALNNRFTAIDDSSDDDEETKEDPKKIKTAADEFPVLSSYVTLRPHQQKKSQQQNVLSFAAVALAASHLPDPVYISRSVREGKAAAKEAYLVDLAATALAAAASKQQLSSADEYFSKNKSAGTGVAVASVSRNWADDYDDEDEDEDENEDYADGDDDGCWTDGDSQRNR